MTHQMLTEVHHYPMPEFQDPNPIIRLMFPCSGFRTLRISTPLPAELDSKLRVHQCPMPEFQDPNHIIRLMFPCSGFALYAPLLRSPLNSTRNPADKVRPGGPRFSFSYIPSSYQCSAYHQLPSSFVYFNCCTPSSPSPSFNNTLIQVKLPRSKSGKMHQLECITVLCPSLRIRLMFPCSGSHFTHLYSTLR